MDGVSNGFGAEADSTVMFEEICGARDFSDDDQFVRDVGID
jgi:hypothetical protein